MRGVCCSVWRYGLSVSRGADVPDAADFGDSVCGPGRPIGDMDNREKQTVINEALGEFLHVMMWRRSLHQHPELSFEEHRTSKVVAEALQHEGIEYRSVAGTGVLARIEGTKACVGRERDALVLRADMDALPIAEATGLEFASVHKGVMHACGHDGHIAMLLSAAKILKNMEASLNGRVVLMFEEGEEGHRNIEKLLAYMAEKDMKFDTCYASHVR